MAESRAIIIILEEKRHVIIIIDGCFMHMNWTKLMCFLILIMKFSTINLSLTMRHNNNSILFSRILNFVYLFHNYNMANMLTS
jgi:cytochrome c oxidase subunit IV